METNSYKDTDAYLVSLDVYKDISSDDKTTNGTDLVIFATSFKEAESKTINEIGQEWISKIWGITIIDAIAIP